MRTFTCALTGTETAIGTNKEGQEIAIETIGICTLFDNLGYTTEQLLKMSYDDECKIVMDWCKENNFHYYGRPREDYFKHEGVKEAIHSGKVGVVLEDLS